MNPASEFLGLHFDGWSSSDVEQWLANRCANSEFRYVVTPNVDHVVRLANAEDAIRLAYASADLCLCDSRVLRRLAKIYGIDLELTTGSDLVEKLFRQFLKAGDRVCLIGGSEIQAFKLQMLYPNLTIFHHDAPMGLLGNTKARADAIDFANSANARITLIGIGSPQQELLGWEMSVSGKVRGTALCIGASVDFLVGEQIRAPRVVQTVGLEWMWRLLHNPRRLARRYLVDGPAIFPIVIKWRWEKQRRVR